MVIPPTPRYSRRLKRIARAIKALNYIEALLMADVLNAHMTGQYFTVPALIEAADFMEMN